MKPEGWRRFFLQIEHAFVCVLFLATPSMAQGESATMRAEIAQWAGSYETDAFLRQPAVSAELQSLVGGELDHLFRNLNVRGAIDVIGSTLSLSGNAPHQGTEEEAVVCVTPGRMVVEAAILSRDTVTVYTRAKQYEHTSLCIKDWITLANSRHADRLVRPPNVHVVRPR